jgi:putative transposase
MPRLPRKYDDIGIYHIMVRGNAKQDIFIDSQDKRKFIKTIIQKRIEGLFAIYAFCIMSNHAHLIVKEEKESISKFMKRITISYAFYFNAKYDRVGHVFQDRFKSEAIKDDSYLLSAIRYVHNNPEKAGIMNKENYPWSSYKWYVSPDIDNKLTGVSEVLKMFSLDIEESVKIFKKFSNKVETREFLDINQGRNINKDNVEQFLNKFLNKNSMIKDDLCKKKYVKQRNDLIRTLVSNSNISRRNISEIIGLNRETVRRVSKEPSL